MFYNYHDKTSYGLDHIVTPLLWQSWQASPVEHPNRAFVNWLIAEMQDGFRIGYTCGRPKSLQQNPISALERPQVFREYLAKECAEGRIMGLFAASELPQLLISHFGIIPKSTPGKWQLIVDMSSPEGHSMNDSISVAHYSLSYVSIKDAVKVIIKEGWGAHLTDTNMCTL